jgi:hypothetical protein
VKFPVGKLWQFCLASALDVLPPDTRSAEKDWTLTTWRTSGEPMILPPPRPYSLYFQASPYSFASALLNEVQLLLDHAAEHRALVQSTVSAKNDCSPSWLFVTTYYWSLFAALAFVRLLGKAAWYLDKGSLNSLVAGTMAKAPAAGTYILHVGAIQGSARRDFFLRQSDERFHEATWKLVADLIKPNLDRVIHGATSGQTEQLSEISVFRCLADDPFRTTNWPSSLRNAINYKPGFTYQAVHGVDLIENYTFLRRLSLHDWSSLSDQYLAIAKDVKRGADPQNVLGPSTQLLALKAIILGELTTRLINEVIAERRLDRRWANKRERFLRARIPTTPGEIWPFTSH